MPARDDAVPSQWRIPDAMSVHTNPVPGDGNYAMSDSADGMPSDPIADAMPG